MNIRTPNTKATLFIFAFVAIQLMSCSKGSSKDNSQNGFSGIPKVKTWADGNTVTTYTYNTNGQLIKEESTNGNSTTYVYSSGEVRKSYFINNTPNGYNLFSLNANGYISTITSSSNTTGSATFTYNADQTIATEINSFSTPTLKIDYYFKNENLDSIRATELNGRWYATVSYTYYLDKVATNSDYNFGRFFYGKNSKNVAKSRHESYPGTLIRHFDYECTYDQQDRISTFKIIELNGSTITQRYTYY